MITYNNKPIIKVYIASPYRAKTEWGVEQNIQTARYWGSELIKKFGKEGYYPIIPHMNTAHMSGLMDEEYFLAGTTSQLADCDFIYLCPGWESSEGCKAEKEYCEKHRIPRLFEEL